MLIQNNYYQNSLSNRFATKANSPRMSTPAQNSSQIPFEGQKSSTLSSCKKVAIGAVIAVGLLIAADVVFNKGKNLKRLQKKFLGLFNKKPKSQKIHNALPQGNTKVVADANVPTANVKPGKVADATPSTTKIKPTNAVEIKPAKIVVKEIKNPKGKVTTIERFEFDEAGNILKFTSENPQRGTIASYNYVTGEYTVQGARYKVKNAAGEIVEEVRTINYPVEKIDPENINFTQQSMGENYRDLVASFREKGWQGQPVDLVRTKDGQFISMDNRRIAAAREAGIDVHAIIHELDEPLTSGKCAQYRIKDPKTKDAFEPATWGEAIYNRLFQNGLTEPSGGINLIAAHHVPSTIPDALLETRKASLFNLYFLGLKPYSPIYF